MVTLLISIHKCLPIKGTLRLPTVRVSVVLWGSPYAIEVDDSKGNLLKIVCNKSIPFPFQMPELRIERAWTL